ncbi:hypothetical protein G7046_g349 [Stylonectria norvegica]|nr:hypothetical protein G7046_g349 [Stylonectria norvegica]
MPSSPSSRVSAASSSSTSRTASRRLLKELDTWRTEQKTETGIERLGPVGDGDLLAWEAVINGRGVGRPLAPHHRPAHDVSPPPSENHLRHPHRPPQHRPDHGRDLPRPAQGRLDPRIQRAGESARRAHAAQLP